MEATATRGQAETADGYSRSQSPPTGYTRLRMRAESIPS